jgi:hypothetical protein
MQQIAGPVLAKMNILRKKGMFSLKMVGIGQAPGFILHCRNVRNFIGEKGSYNEYSAEPRPEPFCFSTADRRMFGSGRGSAC